MKDANKEVFILFILDKELRLVLCLQFVLGE